jgi:hypothetical protein
MMLESYDLEHAIEVRLLRTEVEDKSPSTVVACRETLEMFLGWSGRWGAACASPQVLPHLHHLAEGEWGSGDRCTTPAGALDGGDGRRYGSSYDAEKAAWAHAKRSPGDKLARVARFIG